MNVMVTGHRPRKLGNAYELYHPINIMIGRRMRNLVLSLAGYDSEEDEFAYQEPITMISGMALGIDTVYAMVCLKLKKDYPGRFRLCCAIPCLNQEKKWSKKDQERYHKILNQADEVHYVTETEYTDSCMQERNEFMVDIADYLYGIWDGSPSGTKRCIDYAKKQQIPCQIDDPSEWINQYKTQSSG